MAIDHMRIELDRQFLLSLTPGECREKAKDDRARFLDRYKLSYCNAVPFTAASKALGCSRYRIEQMAFHNLVWCGLKDGTKVVDIAECQKLFDAPAPPAKRKCKDHHEPAPVEMKPLVWLAHEIGLKSANTLYSWVKRNELASTKYFVSHPGGRSGLEHHATLDAAIALFREKRKRPTGKRLRRDTRLPKTDLIRDLWGIDQELHGRGGEIPPIVAGAWKELRE